MENRITGVMVYYYFVCKRKLWYFSNEIQMEGDNENVQLGKLLDEESYKRDEKHINIDNIINIDFIKDHNELHEIKKSRAIEEAGIWQIKYYLCPSFTLLSLRFNRYIVECKFYIMVPELNSVFRN